MKRGLILLFVLVFISCFSLAYAHQPRYVMNQDEIQVQNPEVSQAFYGELRGSEDYYALSSDNDFELYVNILSGKSGRTDFVVDVNGVKLGGGNWSEFYEEFAGDDYLKGPEYDENVPAGNYLIKVSNTDNSGKYVLAVGKIERFSAGDLLVLPKIKHDFFGKSYFAVFQGIIGHSALVFLVILALVIVLIIWLIVRKVRKKKK